MANKNQFTAAEFIEAIPGTAGIVTTIAKKIGCDWHTARKYIDEYPTIKQAYDDECERNLDLAESVILKAIQGGDTGDAKWYLTRKGKHRGYVERTETDLTSGGEKIQPTIIEIVKSYESTPDDDE
jgi:hypothetical protein